MIRLRLTFDGLSPRDWDAMSRGGNLAGYVYCSIKDEETANPEACRAFWGVALGEERPDDFSVRLFVLGALARGIPSSQPVSRSRAELAGEQWAATCATAEELMDLREHFDSESRGSSDASSCDGSLAAAVHQVIRSEESADPDECECFWEDMLGNGRPSSRSVRCFVRGALAVSEGVCRE